MSRPTRDRRGAVKPDLYSFEFSEEDRAELRRLAGRPGLASRDEVRAWAHETLRSILDQLHANRRATDGAVASLLSGVREGRGR
jgi:hypothetical protein